MNIPKKYQFKYVCCLPECLEKQIMIRVKRNISKIHFLSKEEKQEAIENANCSKVYDLEDTIKIIYI